MKKSITFVTSNKGKVASSQKYFNGTNIELEIFKYDLIEPRTDDIKEIATSKVLQAYELVKKPCIALDVGFFIEELNGFPRAFVNFALNTIGISGILKLMDEKSNRSCFFEEYLAYYDGKKIEYFSCKIPGTLAYEILGDDTSKKWSDLWYIFVPEGYTKTLAQMTDEERQERSNTKPPEAFQLFANWMKQI